jgi:hypothetical protein
MDLDAWRWNLLGTISSLARCFFYYEKRGCMYEAWMEWIIMDGVGHELWRDNFDIWRSLYDRMGEAQHMGNQSAIFRSIYDLHRCYAHLHLQFSV